MWVAEPARGRGHARAMLAAAEEYAIRRGHGSFGSRLHRTLAGDFVGYAQWPSEKLWRTVYEAHFPHDDPDAAAMFRAAIEVSHGPELLMEVTDDLLDLVRA